MKIDRILISNFKLFAKQEFAFHPSFNLVIGTNGCGKTSLLRAVAVAMGGWAHAYIRDVMNRRPIGESEIREVQIDKRFDKSKNVRIEAWGEAAIVDRYGVPKTGKAQWQRYRVDAESQTQTTGKIDYGNGTMYPLNFSNLGHDTLSYIEQNKSFDLPIIAFYECDRLWLSKDEIDPVESAVVKYSRFDPYVDCFHTGADHKSLGQWLLKHELASMQQKVDTPVLLSIRQAAKAALEGCSDLRFDFDEGRVVVEFTDGHAVPFEHLSDGQRTMLGLFCDLARRAAILNPHFGGEASVKTSGVVLIDELDLHLHPKWQRRIVEELKSTFPKIQFICTTHSPQLIGQAKPGEIIVLNLLPDQSVKSSVQEVATKSEVDLLENRHPPQSFGMDSNWVLRHIMGSTDRDPKVATKLDAIFKLIDGAEFKQAQKGLDVLREEIGEHPELVEAQALISRYTRFDTAPAG